MRATRSESLEAFALQQAYERIQEDRSEQYPSVSNLNYCLTKTFWDRENGGIPKVEDKTKLFFILGLGLEDSLMGTTREDRAGEFEGIYYHIDGEDSDSVIECKTTRMRTRKGTGRGNPGRDIEVTDYSEAWLRQIMAYCKARGKYKAKLEVLHLIEPAIRGWILEFTPEDLDTNWAWLQDRRRVLMAAHDSKKPPTPFKYNMDWECQGCNWKMLCDLGPIMEGNNNAS